MRQSFAQFEEAFHEEAAVDAKRRDELRRAAAERSKTRRREKVHKRGTLRFAMLVLAILATSVAVTIVMFQTLALIVS